MRYFFRVIFKNVDIKQAIRLEIEDDLGFIFRSIPGFIGYLFRYFIYKLLMKEIGSFPFISGNVRFMHSNRIRLGKGVLINANCYLYGKGGISIGDNVLISPGCAIVAGNHSLNPDVPILEQPSMSEEITIGQDCWIGANAVLVGGVTLAEGSVIGAGAVVTKDTSPYSINAGIPARKIGSRRATIDEKT